MSVNDGARNEDLQLTIADYFTDETNDRHLILYANSKDTRSKLKRVLYKNGRINTYLSHLPDKQLRYLKDLGNTLINIRWRWILGCVFVANMFAYIFFGFVWMAAAYYSGDLDEKSPDNYLCVVGTKTFSGYLILSIETITTIGTGFIYPTDCHVGWMIIMMQVIVGVIIEGILITAVYVKMSRPVYKDNVDLFSKKAIISLRDGTLSFMFRVRDNCGKYRTRTSIKAYYVERRRRTDCEVLENYMRPLQLENYGLLMWPLEIVHRITEDSPLWHVSAEELLTKRFEIFAIIEGDSLTTGQTSQSRTSYLNTEILWGHRYVPCVHYDVEWNKYYVDHESFDATTRYAVPLCSAERLYRISRSYPNDNRIMMDGE